MKLIIDIPDNEYKYTCERTLSDRTFWDDAIRKGTPLDDVIAVIKNEYYTEKEPSLYQAGTNFGLSLALEILDNIARKVRNE